MGVVVFYKYNQLVEFLVFVVEMEIHMVVELEDVVFVVRKVEAVLGFWVVEGV